MATQRVGLAGGTVDAAGIVELGPASATPADEYQFTLVSGPSTLGPGGGTSPPYNGGGSAFGFDQLSSTRLAIFVPAGYVSGTNFTTLGAFTGAYSSLGLAVSTYTYAYGGTAAAPQDTITVQVLALPEPGSAVLLVVAGLGLACRWYPRRCRA